jgi:heterokaryon incompatibility protein (HET)
MADIFSSAYRVVICLGPESADTLLALECVSLIAFTITPHWGRGEIYAKEDHEDVHKLLKASPFDEKQYLAMKNPFDSDWFQRFWIRQEARLASSATIVVRETHYALW